MKVYVGDESRKPIVMLKRAAIIALSGMASTAVIAQVMGMSVRNVQKVLKAYKRIGVMANDNQVQI